MIYPQEYVDVYGAKSGLLKYIKESLPQIPQAKSVTMTLDMSPEEALLLAETNSIGWPRLFRSSAKEELDGFEGLFRTIPQESYAHSDFSDKSSFHNNLIKKLLEVRKEPRRLKSNFPGQYDFLPDDISVILAEETQSRYCGTFIKHPNRQDEYFFCLKDVTISEDAIGGQYHSNFSYVKGKGFQVLGKKNSLSQKSLEESSYFQLHQEKIFSEMEETISWYEQIIDLPKMDSNWSYQIEFGLDPLFLYQVRPFKELALADFKVENSSSSKFFDDEVIGITSCDGINVYVFNERFMYDLDRQDKSPKAFCGDLRTALFSHNLTNRQVNMFSNAKGLLQHDDIGAMRHAQVNILSIRTLPYSHGDYINVKSDGYRFQITPLE